MSKPNKCPPHLRLVIDRVADYVGRHHHGLNSNELLRVDIYARQNKKDRAQALDILVKQGVLAVSPVGKGELWVRHTKHPVLSPAAAPAAPFLPVAAPEKKCKVCGQFKTLDKYGDDDFTPGQKAGICLHCEISLSSALTSKVMRKINNAPKQCTNCGKSKPLSEFAAIPGGGVTDTCTLCLELIKPKKPETPMTDLNNLSPEAMRQLAAQLEKQAAEREKNGKDREQFNKALAPLKAEVVRAHGMATRKLDECIDAMAELGKAVNALRDFKIE